jgi:hypothetical protein
MWRRVYCFSIRCEDKRRESHETLQAASWGGLLLEYDNPVLLLLEFHFTFDCAVLL